MTTATLQLSVLRLGKGKWNASLFALPRRHGAKPLAGVTAANRAEAVSGLADYVEACRSPGVNPAEAARVIAEARP